MNERKDFFEFTGIAAALMKIGAKDSEEPGVAKEEPPRTNGLPGKNEIVSGIDSTGGA